MNTEHSFYMSECNKRGIRVFPRPHYGYYKLVIEYNRSENFDAKYVKKIVEGKDTYSIENRAWCDKIFEIYKDIYTKKIKPKLTNTTS